MRPQVFHADSPVDHWKIPQKKADQGYEKTQVEASREGVVVRHVEATATTDTQVEEGIIVDDGRVDGGSGESAGSGESGERTGPESKIDLFDVFNTGKSDE